MASQLALLFARRLEVPVVLTDLDQERVDKGLSYVHKEIDKLAGKGRLSEGKAAKLRGLVTGSVDKSVYADADFVIEAFFEYGKSADNKKYCHTCDYRHQVRVEMGPCPCTRPSGNSVKEFQTKGRMDKNERQLYLCPDFSLLFQSGFLRC